MKIIKEEVAKNDLLIRVTVSEADYAEAVEKSLREYKRKANIPGFRPGMVPIGVVKKMFGRGALAEQSYRTASEAAYNYLQTEKIEILGDPIPSDQQKEMDFDTQTEFEFIFEVGQAPALDLAFTDKDKLVYPVIEPDKEMLKSARTNFLRQYGHLEEADKVTSDEALTVTLDNAELRIEEAYLGLISLSESARKPFIGKSKGFKTKVDITELYPSEQQRAAILQLKPEELAGLNPDFELEITGIRRFTEPALDEAFFKQNFPKGDVTNEKQLGAHIQAGMAADLRRESDYYFSTLIRMTVLKKAHLEMPEAFLRRWLYTINEGKFTMEQIEAEFAPFLNQFTWNFIQRRIVAEQKIAVTADDAAAEARRMAALQFAQYGMPNAPEELLADFASRLLADKERANNIYEGLYDQRVTDYFRTQFQITEKGVSTKEFAELAGKLHD